MASHAAPPPPRFDWTKLQSRSRSSLPTIESVLKSAGSGAAPPADVLAKVQQELVDLSAFLGRSRTSVRAQIESLLRQVRQVADVAPAQRLSITIPAVSPSPPAAAPRSAAAAHGHGGKRPSQQRGAEAPRPAPAPEKAAAIWALTNRFFGALPSDAAIDGCFAVVAQIPAGASPPPPPSREHWAARFREFARRNPALAAPPGPAPSAAEADPFWDAQAVPFPVEALQHRRASPLHALLGALVEIDDDDAAARAPRRRAFLAEHALLPEIPCDPYLALPFEARLALELASLEIDEPDDAPGMPPTEVEVQKVALLREMGAISPAIRECEGEIRARIAEYRQDERQRREAHERIDALLHPPSRAGRRAG
jgi:hypothetical protein